MHTGKTMVRDGSGSLSNHDTARHTPKRLTTITMHAPQSSEHRRRRSPQRIAGSILVALLASFSARGTVHAEPRHAIAMHAEPALPVDFSHFRYADPAAPKGGRLVQGVLGTFESINPFIARGLVAQGMRG